MKKLTLLFLISAHFAIAQNQTSQDNYVSNFNGFQRTYPKYPDSGIVYLHRLTNTKPKDGEDLIHNSFAQTFIKRDEEALYQNHDFLARLKRMNMTLDSVKKMNKERVQNAYIILDKLKNDPNPSINNSIFAITKWDEAQRNFNNSNKLLEIGKEYLKFLKTSDDFYADRKARYGLLIAKVMYNDEKLRPAADEIIKIIYNNLRDHQTTEAPSVLARAEKEKRSWYRYLFAYCNFISAQNDSNKDKKLEFLRLAFQYSPDTFDKTVSHSYFYDMTFLFGDEKYSFEEDYLAALSNDEEKFNTLMTMSISNPSFKAKAKSLAKDQSKFNDYWLAEFNKTAKVAPLFSLAQIDGNQYTLGSKKDQWTLIDFWGTWCSPCRKEHPDLQNLYQQTKEGKINLNIITVVSEDTEQAVKEYMKKFAYGFPVVMSDNQMEKKYNVSSWPSKFLVSPQGKYVIIPFNVDWQKYITEYIN